MKSMKYLIIIVAVLAISLNPVCVYAGHRQSLLVNPAEEVFTLFGGGIEQANRHLRYAAKTNNLDGVNEALRAGANVNHSERNGQTALLVACRKGHSVIVERLLNGGAHVNQSEQNGVAPLLMACLFGHSVIVELLLNRGAHVNQVDRDGGTSLMEASLPVIVKLLLSHGADVNHVNRYSETALLAACRKGLPGIIKILAFHGATLFENEWVGEFRAIIEQAQEARKQFDDQVGDQDWVPQELVASGQLTNILAADLHTLVADYADPLAGIDDSDIQQLIEERVAKNRERRQEITNL